MREGAGKHGRAGWLLECIDERELRWAEVGWLWAEGGGVAGREEVWEGAWRQVWRKVEGWRDLLLIMLKKSYRLVNFVLELKSVF